MVPSSCDQKVRDIAVAALANKSLKDVSYDPRTIVPTHFSHTLSHTVDVMDQESSGTCWLHAAAALVNLEARRQKRNVNASVRYWQFFDKIEKSMAFLRRMTQTSDAMERYLLSHDDALVPDGGNFAMFAFLFNKYGHMPRIYFDGSYQTKHSDQINTELKRYLRDSACLVERRQKTLEQCENEVVEIMRRAYGGMPIHTFELTHHTHGVTFHGTPCEFAKTIIFDSFQEMVTICHLPDRPHGWYVEPFSNDRTNVHQSYLCNVDFDTFATSCKNSILGDLPVFFTCDASYMVNYKTGVMDIDIYNTPLLLGFEPMRTTKRDRCRYHNTAPNHAMLITGVHLDDNGKIVRWLVQNSHGYRRDDKIIMSNEWFEEYAFTITLHQKFLSAKLPARDKPTPVSMIDILSVVA